ncbi:sugar phosphate isomerase/epimerase [Bradyrhizobium sp. SRS-191]|uniref:sugar phosphate isomerase/epimerase family protein n=1 Tax=Bradyrhizobium sp. SRS-191 TaxID=2962606 RepID=UPI00211ED580|nr:sugar phosphate isomerase/epimerase family protein [Bradyrhizobium sp. SRS-191]
MKLAISNIAWSPEERAGAYASMRRHGVAGLEIAPGLFFAGAADPFAPDEAEAAPVLAEAADAGLALVSMQSLLFGVQGAALFGDADAQARFIAGMHRAIALARRFGIPNLVFGSPTQRVVPEGLAADAARNIAVGVFRSLGDAAAAARTRLGVEFNPAVYETNFLTTHDEVADFVAAVNHPAVTIILDLGALHMNGHFEDIEAIAARLARHVSHVHVSEPLLGPAPAQPEQAARAMRAMRAAAYDGWFSVEMKRPGDGLAGVDAALERLTAAAALAE